MIMGTIGLRKEIIFGVYEETLTVEAFGCLRRVVVSTLMMLRIGVSRVARGTAGSDGRIATLMTILIL